MASAAVATPLVDQIPNQTTDILFLQNYLNTNLEDLLGNDELTAKFARIQHGFDHYGGNGGLFFGQKNRATKDSRVHQACRDELPDIILIEVCIGGRSFMACQRFGDLHPYSQYTLRALHNLDLQQPMCFIEDANERRRWKDYWTKQNRSTFVRDTQELYDEALAHLAFLLLPQGTESEPGDSYSQTMRHEIESAMRDHITYDFEGNVSVSLWDMWSKQSKGFAQIEADFLKLSRCPSPDLPDRVEPHLIIGRRAESHRSQEMARYPMNEQTIEWTTNKLYTPDNGNNMLINFTTGLSVRDPNEGDMFAAFSTLINQPSAAELRAKSGLSVREAAAAAAAPPYLLTSNNSLHQRDISKFLYLHICIVHPSIVLEITMPVTRITKSIVEVLTRVCQLARTNDLTRLQSEQLLEQVQDWMLHDVTRRAIRTAPYETLDLAAYFVLI